MRAIAAVSTIFLMFVMAVHGCGIDDKPLFPNASSSGMTMPEDAGLDGPFDAAVDTAPPTCAPDMGQTACDKCVYEQCCAEALECSAGTPCDALRTCARNAGCLDPQESDFDTCAAAACPEDATEPAVAAIEALATCIQNRCGDPCGG